MKPKFLLITEYVKHHNEDEIVRDSCSTANFYILAIKQNKRIHVKSFWRGLITINKIEVHDVCRRWNGNDDVNIFPP
jgi:hypothetical protein